MTTVQKVDRKPATYRNYQNFVNNYATLKKPTENGTNTETQPQKVTDIVAQLQQTGAGPAPVNHVTECAKIFEPKPTKIPTDGGLGDRRKMFEKPALKPKIMTKMVKGGATKSQGRIQGTLPAHQIAFSVEKPDGVDVHSLEANDPMAKKIANGAMRSLFDNYAERASVMAGDQPQNENQVDVGKIIEHLSSNGGLEKLSGRGLPKKAESSVE